MADYHTYPVLFAPPVTPALVDAAGLLDDPVGFPPPPPVFGPPVGGLVCVALY